MTKPVAIVTGASRGVGRAVAILLAEKGWNLTLTCSSSLEEAQKVAKECNDLGAETLVLTADVSDESKCQETVQKTINKWKRLDTFYDYSTAINHGVNKYFATHTAHRLVNKEGKIIELFDSTLLEDVDNKE